MTGQRAFGNRRAALLLCPWYTSSVALSANDRIMFSSIHDYRVCINSRKQQRCGASPALDNNQEPLAELRRIVETWNANQRRRR